MWVDFDLTPSNWREHSIFPFDYIILNAYPSDSVASPAEETQCVTMDHKWSMMITIRSSNLTKIDVCHGCREPPWHNSGNAQNHTYNNGDNVSSEFQAMTSMTSHDSGNQPRWWWQQRQAVIVYDNDGWQRLRGKERKRESGVVRKEREW